MKIGNLKIETIGTLIVSYIAINMFLMFAIDCGKLVEQFRL